MHYLVPFIRFPVAATVVPGSCMSTERWTGFRWDKALMSDCVTRRSFAADQFCCSTGDGWTRGGGSCDRPPAVGGTSIPSTGRPEDVSARRLLASVVSQRSSATGRQLSRHPTPVFPRAPAPPPAHQLASGRSVAGLSRSVPVSLGRSTRAAAAAAFERLMRVLVRRGVDAAATQLGTPVKGAAAEREPFLCAGRPRLASAPSPAAARAAPPRPD